MANEGTRTVPLAEDVTEDPKKLNALASSVGDKFAAVFGSSNPDDPNYEEELEEEELEEEDEGTLEEEPEEAEEDESESEEEVAEEEPAPKAKDVANPLDIPDNLVRAALHSEWTMDDIRKMYKTDPELTLKTLQKQYDDNNNVTRLFSEAGRRGKKPQGQPDAAPAVPTSGRKKLTLKLPTAEELKRQYPDDSLIDDQVIPMQNQMMDMVTVINDLQDQIGNSQLNHEVAVNEVTQSADDRAAQTEINAFFENSTMGQFAPIYGERKMGQTWAALTPDQSRNRREVCDLAENIFLGAQAYGRPLSTEAALLKAHLVTTDEYRTKIIRNDLVAKTKKRSKSIQLKPSQGKRTKVQGSESGKPKSEAEFEAKVRNKMKKTFGT